MDTLRPAPVPPPAPAVLPDGPAGLAGDALSAGHPLHRRVEVVVDRTPVGVRPVLPGDAAAIDRFVRDLSLRSRELRYHAPVHALTSRQLAGVVDVDHRRRETLVATVRRRGRDRLVGLGQYVAVGGGRVEVALAVADRWQRRGVGRVLVAQLLRAAQEAGFREAAADVLAENRAALRIVAATRPPARLEHHGTTVTATVPLGDPPCRPADRVTVPATASARGAA